LSALRIERHTALSRRGKLVHAGRRCSPVLGHEQVLAWLVRVVIDHDFRDFACFGSGEHPPFWTAQLAAFAASSDSPDAARSDESMPLMMP